MGPGPEESGHAERGHGDASQMRSEAVDRPYPLSRCPSGSARKEMVVSGAGRSSEPAHPTSPSTGRLTTSSQGGPAPQGARACACNPKEHGLSCTRGGRATGDPSGSSGAASTAARGRADKTPPGGDGKQGGPIPLGGGARGADQHRQLSIWTAHPLAGTVVWIRPTIRARTQWARSHASGHASAGSRLRGDGLAHLPPERFAGQDSQSVRIGSRRPERSSRFRTSRRRGSPPTGRGEANLTFGPGRWMPHARVPEWPARSSVRAALWSRPSGWPPSRRLPGAQ